MSLDAASLEWAGAGDAPALAAAHALAFPQPWGASEFEALLTGAGVFALIVRDAEGQPVALALCRTAAGEMEVLTLGVAPHLRRSGLARTLMRAALAAAREAAATEAFLEVAVDNEPAVRLYQSLGFARSGVRRAYYDRGAAGRVDALVMRLDLSAEPA